MALKKGEQKKKCKGRYHMLPGYVATHGPGVKDSVFLSTRLAIVPHSFAAPWPC